MTGLELLSDQGYRVDGRRAGELRKIQARMGVFAQARKMQLGGAEKGLCDGSDKVEE